MMNLHPYPISADLVFSFTFEENWYQRFTYEPVREKTNNLGSDQVPTQTRLYSHRSRLEA